MASADCAKEPTKASGGAGLQGIVKAVVNTFLEKQHFRQLHRTLSEQWSGCHSLTAAVRLMEAHGVRVTPQEEAHLAQLSEERMIDALVSKMPQQSREQFEHFFLQLSFIASTTTRLRVALEAGLPDAIEDAIESAENVGVLPYVMKMAVAQAGQEVKNIEGQQDSWLGDVDVKMKPLLQSQASSMHVQKALAQARAQVETTFAESKEKTYAVMMGQIAGNQKVIQNTSFIAWADLTKKLKREAEIRKDYEVRINEAQKRLMEYKAAQLANVRKVIGRTSAEGTTALLTQVVGALKQEAASVKSLRDAKAEMAELDSHFKSFAERSAQNAKKTMAAMSKGSEEGLRATAFQGWVTYYKNYLKDKEMNDAVRAAEMKVSGFMKKQNDGAKSVLQRMTQQSETGLITSVFQGWAEAVKEAKEENEMESLLHAKSSKMASFTGRNKGSAKNASHRSATLLDQNTLIYFFLFWARDSKTERMRRYGKEKTNRRKQELQGVKGLFKNFASELETSLQEGTPRVDKEAGKHRKRNASVGASSAGGSAPPKDSAKEAPKEGYPSP